MLLASLPFSGHPQRPRDLLATHLERPGSLGHGKLGHCSLSLSSVTERCVQPLPEFAAWEVTHPSLAPWTKGKSCSEQEERKTVYRAEVVKAGSRAPGQVVR